MNNLGNIGRVELGKMAAGDAGRATGERLKTACDCLLLIFNALRCDGFNAIPGNQRRGEVLALASQQPGGRKAADQPKRTVIDAENLPVLADADIVDTDRFFAFYIDN